MQHGEHRTSNIEHPSNEYCRAIEFDVRCSLFPSMKRTAVINVVGLTDALIGEHMPRIRDFAARASKANVEPAFPAVTCTAQSTYLTGATHNAHGIVGNGWYNRELAEVQF